LVTKVEIIGAIEAVRETKTAIAIHFNLLISTLSTFWRVRRSISIYLEPS